MRWPRPTRAVSTSKRACSGGFEMGPTRDDAETLRVVLADEWSGRRADDAVLRSFPGFSRKEVKELFEAGRVRGSGRRLKKGDRVEIGTELVVEAPLVAIAPDASIPLTVLFESQDFVIVDKPAG